MSFRDRSDAGKRLARALQAYADDDPIVLALPRGGVPVAAEVARALAAPLDLLLVRKIGVPQQPELAMGAVVDGAEPITVRNEDVIRMADISEADFAEVRDRELKEIDRRRQLYLAGRPFPELAGRTVIVVDDGIATGATMRAALQALRRRKPRRLVLAVPVAATSTLKSLRKMADDTVCLDSEDGFGAIGYYYADFRQIADREVIQTMAEFTAPKPATAAPP